MLRDHPKFERDSAPRYLRRFCPDYHVASLEQIKVEDLRDAGVKAILLDLDNTLLPWKGLEIPETTVAWIASCRAAGIKLCLVSNTRNMPRLQGIASKLGIPYVRAKLKPAKDGFHKALRELDCNADDAVMIGDQMFTDIWGGNRMGIPTIWVEPMAKREFVGTKVSRLVEKLVLRMLIRAKSR